jgi:hypothetical protein
VREWTEAAGEPDEVEEGRAAWYQEDTAFSLFLGETDSGYRYLAAEYAGPGYEEEIQRRVAAMSAPIEHPPLDARWAEVPLERSVRTSYDRATIQRMGNRVLRVWVREDYGHLQTDPVEHDTVLMQTDYDCGARRFRIGAATYQRQGRVVHNEARSGPSEWVAIPPETLAETMITTICAAAESR